MDHTFDFSKLLSPVWWLTTVIGAVLLSLFNSYLKDLLNAGFALVSTKWSMRNRRAKEKHDKLVAGLRNDEKRRERHFRDELRARLSATGIFVMSCAFLLLTLVVSQQAGEESFARPHATYPEAVRWFRVVCFVSGALSILTGNLVLSRANVMRRQLKEADMPISTSAVSESLAPSVDDDGHKPS